MAGPKRTISFTLTTRCNIRCKHCITEAGPTGADVAREDLAEWLEQARNAAYREVCFTGGESFLVQDLLGEAARTSRDLGLAVTVLTNAFWARSPEEARRVLGRLTGIQTLAISYDAFHREYIPSERVVFASQAAAELGMKAILIGSYMAGESSTILGHPDIPEVSQPVIRAGRAAAFFSEDQFVHGEVTRRCSELAPFVGTDGEVYACCTGAYLTPPGSQLRVGNLRTSTLLEIAGKVDRQPILQALRTFGPHWLWSCLAANGSVPDLDQTHHCAVCLSLFRDLALIERLKALGEESELQRKVRARRVLLFQELPAEVMVRA